MPQMSPLNWITLMIYFLMLFYMFNMFNYYLSLFTPTHKKTNMKNIKLNWKW